MKFFLMRCKTAQRVMEDFAPSALWFAAGLPAFSNDNQKGS